MIFPDWAGYLRFRDDFEEVMDPRFYTIGWLDQRVLDGSVRLWCSDEAAIIAEIKVYPAGGMVVHGLIAAGELDGIRTLIPLAEEWGRSEGCVEAGIESREGWSRALRQDGYAVHQIALRKEL